MCESNEVKERKELWKVSVLAYGTTIGNLLDQYRNTTTFEEIESETKETIEKLSQNFVKVHYL